jgi:MoxR-like ATPase
LSNRFRLVRRDLRSAAEDARQSLFERPAAESLTQHQDAAAYYELDDSLETAVNMALTVGAPLLVTGEPGTGKTQLAFFLGHYFGIQVRSFYVKSTSTAKDLKYEFDAVGYLQSAYMAQQGAPSLPRTKFLKEGPLWRTYEDSQPSVLLIDEIDKAPRDFPNDLLHELDQGWFPHPFERNAAGEPTRIPQQPGRRPILVITSNLERRLPDAFLRRCVFHHIVLTEAVVKRAVQARAEEFPNLPPDIRNRAVERFWELRERGLQKPPSTAELLVWLAVLDALEIALGNLDGPLSELPALGCLLKDRDDLERLRSL